MVNIAEKGGAYVSIQQRWKGVDNYGEVISTPTPTLTPAPSPSPHPPPCSTLLCDRDRDRDRDPKPDQVIGFRNRADGDRWVVVAPGEP